MAGVTAAWLRTARNMIRTASYVKAFRSNQVRFVTLPSSPDAAKRGIEELKEAASHADYVTSRSKEATKVAENIVEKSKDSMQEAWSATKDAAQKAQNTIAKNAEATKDTVK